MEVTFDEVLKWFLLLFGLFFAGLLALTFGQGGGDALHALFGFFPRV